MRIQSNIERGATTTRTGLIVGGFAEHCLLCNAPLSSDGCSNTQCDHFRGEPALQTALRSTYNLKRKPTWSWNLFRRTA